MPRKDDIREIDLIVKEEGLSKEQRQLLHREITGEQLSLKEIRELAREIKELYPNK
jgi:hemolysin activation/secretion protein